jgi:DNA polymerase elongation subunit (family B)
MLYYNTDELGMLPKSVLNLKTLRDSYKQKRKESSSTEEYNKWDSNQLAVKRLMASFYGVLAYQGFGWADVDLAASITASAREAIREAAFKAREM